SIYSIGIFRNINIPLKNRFFIALWCYLNSADHIVIFIIKCIIELIFVILQRIISNRRNHLCPEIDIVVIKVKISSFGGVITKTVIVSANFGSYNPFLDFLRFLNNNSRNGL